MRFKATKLSPFSYGELIRSSISIKEVAKEAKKRGILSFRPTVLVNLSETGGFTDFIRTVCPLVLNEGLNRTVTFTLDGLTKYGDGSYNISSLVFKLCNVVIVVSRDKISNRCLGLLKELVSEHDATLILDTDDDLFSIPETHPDYKTYQQRLPLYKDLITLSKIVTVSTEYVAASITPYLNNHQRIFVVPNFIDCRIWNLNPRCDHHRETVRALYFGTETHDEDLALISQAIGEADKRLRELHGLSLSLTVIGGTNMPIKNMEVVAVPENKRAYPLFSQWIQQLHSNNPFDFGVAPLDLNNPINESKSNLKFLEYSALGIPAIYTDIKPYHDTVANGHNGILIGNNSHAEWVEALINLSQNAAFRAKLSEGAREELRSNFLLQDNYKVWASILE